MFRYMLLNQNKGQNMEKKEWKEPRFSFYTSGGESNHYYGENIFPILAASSNNHFIILTENNELFKYGETGDENGTNILNKENTLKKFEIPTNKKIFEISCGNNFSVLIHEYNLITIIRQGEIEEKKDFIAPRGLTSNLYHFSFIADYSDVIFYENGKKEKRSTLESDKLVTTAITDKILFILSIVGKIYYSKIKQKNDSNLQFKHFDLQFTVKSVFNTANGVLCVATDNSLHFIDNELKLYNIAAPYNIHIVQAFYFDEELICLDASGRILRGKLSDKRPCLVISKDLTEYHISCISATNSVLTLFRGGNPSPSLSIPSKDKMFLNSMKATIDDQKLLLYTETYAFLTNRRLTSEEFFETIKSNAKIQYEENSLHIYYTDDSRLLPINTNKTLCFTFNFLPGDIVETPDGQRGTLVGVCEGRVWVEPFKGTRLVYCASNPKLLKIVEREGHEICDIIVDGMLVSVDITPTFLEQFELIIGDLFNIPNHGICQLIGSFCGRLVFRDFSDDHFFSTELLTYERVRTSYDKYYPFRSVMTPDGLIEVSILSKGKILMPTDRVETPLGSGTVAGFANGFVYVQTEEMRIAQIGAAKFDPLDLKIIRRIGLPSKRTFYDKESKPKVLSVSTNDKVHNLFAGDRILHHGQRGTVAGVSDNHLFVIFDGTNYISQIDECDLLYRSDILGGPCCETYEVGSPSLGLSTLLPDDVVQFNDEIQYVFKGISKNGPLFIRKDTFEMFSTSFSALITPSSYQLIERRSRQLNIKEDILNENEN